MVMEDFILKATILQGNGGNNRKMPSFKSKKPTTVKIINTLFIFILVLVSVVCLFSGCGGSGEDNNIDNTTENNGNTSMMTDYTVVAPITDGGSFDVGDYE